MSDSLQPHGLYSPWNSLGQHTKVGSRSLLQGIFPTQELNWDLLHCRKILYQLSYQGSPVSIGNFTFFLSNLDAFYLFFLLNCSARTSTAISNSSDENGCTYLVLILERKLVFFHHLL